MLFESILSFCLKRICCESSTTFVFKTIIIWTKNIDPYLFYLGCIVFDKKSNDQRKIIETKIKFKNSMKLENSLTSSLLKPWISLLCMTCWNGCWQTGKTYRQKSGPEVVVYIGGQCGQIKRKKNPRVKDSNS